MHHPRPVLNAAGLAHACAAPEQRVARTAEPEVAVPLTRPCIARQEASCLPSLLFYHTINQSPFRYSTDKVACSCTPCVVSCCARTARAIGKRGWGWCDSCFISSSLSSSHEQPTLLREQRLSARRSVRRCARAASLGTAQCAQVCWRCEHDRRLLVE